MAIQFGRCEFIKRSLGDSATWVAAYQSRSVIRDDRTNQVHDATRWKDDLVHDEVAFPNGSTGEICRSSMLANMAESAEKRKDARVGRMFLFGLPHEVSDEDRLELSRSFIKEHFTDNGLPVHFSIHRPHEGSKNHHLHAWAPMRRLEGDRLATTQARDLLPELRAGPYGAFVSQADRWGRIWADHQERFFRERGLDISVDPIAIHPDKTSGHGRRAWGPNPDNSRMAEFIATRREENIRAVVADAMSVFFHLKNQPYGFNTRDLSAFVAKFVPDPAHRAEVRVNAENAWFDNIVRDLWADRGTVRYGPGHRYLLAEDIARDLSLTLPAAQTELERRQALALAARGELDKLRLDKHDGASKVMVLASLSDDEMSKLHSADQLRRLVEVRLAERQIRMAQPRDLHPTPGGGMLNTSSLYDRYQAERDSASAARKDAEREVHARFGAHQQELRGFYNDQHEQQKLEVRRGRERHQEHEVLKAQERGYRVQAYRLQSQQLARVRAEHPVPSWRQFLEREAGRGDRQATQALQRTREHQRGLEHER